MLLDDIQNWLIDQGLGDLPETNPDTTGATGWPIYKSFMPPTPDQVLCLFETPGEPPDIVRDSSNGEKPYDMPAFQVRMRGLPSAPGTYQALRAQMQLVFQGLHQHEPNVTSGEDYVYIYGVTSGPLPMGKDSNNRDELVWNFRVARKR